MTSEPKTRKTISVQNTKTEPSLYKNTQEQRSPKQKHAEQNYNLWGKSEQDNICAKYKDRTTSVQNTQKQKSFSFFSFPNSLLGFT